MFVVDEDAYMGWGGARHNLDGIDCGTNGCGDFVGAKVESSFDCEAILEDEEG